MEIDTGIDIKELQCFTAVAECYSFSLAAKMLHLAQPTVSVHISTLERKVGLLLFVRTTKYTQITDAGKLFYFYAKKILELRENATEALFKASNNQ